MPRLADVGLAPEFVAELASVSPPVVTVESLFIRDRQEIASQCRVTTEELDQALRTIASTLAAPLESAASLLTHCLKNTLFLSTGCARLDTLLHGGLKTGELVEVVGEPGSGKTQLCLSAAVACVLSTDATVVYLDSVNSFSRTRVTEIFDTRAQLWDQSADVDLHLKRCLYQPVFDAFQMQEALAEIEARLHTQGDVLSQTLRLLVIDSIAAIVRPLLELTEHSEGRALMMDIGKRLKRIATDCDVAVLMTNGVVPDRAAATLADAEPVKAALGISWSYVPDAQLVLSQKHQPRRAASSIDDEAVTERIAELRLSRRTAVPQTTSFTIDKCGLSPEPVKGALSLALPWPAPGAPIAHTSTGIELASLSATAQRARVASQYTAASAGSGGGAGGGAGAGSQYSDSMEEQRYYDDAAEEEEGEEDEESMIPAAQRVPQLA